jgi:hypothetical protein
MSAYRPSYVFGNREDVYQVSPDVFGNGFAVMTPTDDETSGFSWRGGRMRAIRHFHTNGARSGG